MLLLLVRLFEPCSSCSRSLCIFSFAAELAARYKKDGMLAYVELVQRKEKEIGCDVLTHQKWYAIPAHSATTCPHIRGFLRSGANYIDRILASVSSGSSSTSSAGKDSTEHSF
jgi:isocitrate lyase